MQNIQSHDYQISLSQVFLMVGEASKAELLAKNYLKNYSYFENVSGLNFYCGKYKGVYISILIHQIGIDEIDWCSRILFKSNLFNTKLIIRISSCFALKSKVYDCNLYLGSEIFYPDLNFQSVESDKSSVRTYPLNPLLRERILSKAKNLNISIKSISLFTLPPEAKDNELIEKYLESSNADFIDTDSAFLYRNADFYKKNAISLFTCFERNKDNYDYEANIKHFMNISLLALEVGYLYSL